MSGEALCARLGARTGGQTDLALRVATAVKVDLAGREAERGVDQHNWTRNLKVLERGRHCNVPMIQAEQNGRLNWPLAALAVGAIQ